MDIVEVEGTRQTFHCQGAAYRKQSGTYEGKSWSRDYLVLDLVGYQKAGGLKVPTSDKQNTAWEAFNRVFSGSTGKSLNGNIGDAFGGKEVTVAKFRILYNKDFSEERDFVVGVSGQTVIDGEPASQVDSQSTAKNAIVTFLQTNSNVTVENIVKNTKCSASEVADALFDLYVGGDVYEPRPGLYSLVSKTPQEPVKSPTIEDRPLVGAIDLPARACFKFLDDVGCGAKTIETRLASHFCNRAHMQNSQPIGANDFLVIYKEMKEKVMFVLNVLRTSGKISMTTDGITIGTGYTVEEVNGEPVFVPTVQKN